MGTRHGPKKRNPRAPIGVGARGEKLRFQNDNGSIQQDGARVNESAVQQGGSR